jgi:hypothetical protein
MTAVVILLRELVRPSGASNTAMPASSPSGAHPIGSLTRVRCTPGRHQVAVGSLGLWKA